MLKAIANNKFAFEIESDKDKVTINNKEVEADIIKTGGRSFNILLEHKSYNADVISVNHDTKTFIVNINNNRYEIVLKDKFDLLLKQLGMEDIANVKVNEIKAPMPGLVLDIKVNEGDAIEKGDTVLVLEAMKMENIIKSPGAGTVKKVHVESGKAVEKNELLLELD